MQLPEQRGASSMPGKQDACSLAPARRARRVARRSLRAAKITVENDLMHLRRAEPPDAATVVCPELLADKDNLLAEPSVLQQQKHVCETIGSSDSRPGKPSNISKQVHSWQASSRLASKFTCCKLGKPSNISLSLASKFKLGKQVACPRRLLQESHR